MSDLEKIISDKEASGYLNGRIESVHMAKRAKDELSQLRADLSAAQKRISELENDLHERDLRIKHALGRLDNVASENHRLRALLKKAHDAMHSWHSSEYADHPLSLEVSKGLYQ